MKMGDRANIVVKQGAEKVYLYTHWDGFEATFTAAQNALKRAPGRWNDAPYLTRVIFCDLVLGHERDEAGYGIWPKLGDNNNPILVIDIDQQKVCTKKVNGSLDGRIEPVSFNDFIVLAFPE